MRFSRNTFASIHPDLHSGLDAVLLGVRVFYRSRFSPNPLDLSLFSVSICFLVFVFFLEEASAQLRYFSINDRISIVSSSLSRGIEFLSSLKLFCLVFLFFLEEGGEGFLLSFVLEENISSTLKRQVSIKDTIG